MKFILIDFWMSLEGFISNVNTDQCWHERLLLLTPSWASVNQIFDHLVTVVFHIIDLEVDSLFDVVQINLFRWGWSHPLRHHLFLQEWTQLTLILGEVLFVDANFSNNLLLNAHSDLLDLSHALGDHSQILAKILASFLTIESLSVLLELFGESEDFFLWGIKWECKDSFDIFKGGVGHVDGGFELLQLQVKIECGLIIFNQFVWWFLFFVVVFNEARIRKGLTREYRRLRQHLPIRGERGLCFR